MIIDLNSLDLTGFFFISTDGASIGTSCCTNSFEKNIDIFILLKLQEIDPRNMTEMLDDHFHQHKKTTD